MPHAEIIQNGVMIVKPDSRMRRAVHTARQFLAKVGKKMPGVRSLIRHELILRWLHRELHDFAVKQKYRGKAVYLALNDKALKGAKDLAAVVQSNASMFLPIRELEHGIRSAFSMIAREKIRSEYKRKAKKRVQTYGEPWQHRSKK